MAMKHLLLLIGFASALGLASAGARAQSSTSLGGGGPCSPELQKVCVQLCGERGCNAVCTEDTGCECVYGNGKSCP
jgi:hypothetical protein